jgi:hypothetical protein
MHLTNTDDLMREWDLYHVNHACQVFTLEAYPKYHLITAHLKELKIWVTQVAGQTWEVKHILVQKCIKWVEY